MDSEHRLTRIAASGSAAAVTERRSGASVGVRPKDFFPWGMIERARGDESLQRRHAVTEAKACYIWTARPCPVCRARPDALAWFYFRSDDRTWEQDCGTAGWLTVCDRCHVQVNYFTEEFS